MTKLCALLLSDGRPGHYHLAEGVLTALARRRPVQQITRLDISPRRAIPARVMATALQQGASPSLILKLGYGIDARTLPPVDLVISAGGQTVVANAACAQYLNATNVYCGTLKYFSPEAISLTVTSYAAHKDLPNHAVTLKPNGMDPDTLGVASPEFDSRATLRAGPAQAQPVAGLLVGGDSGLFHYEPTEWDQLLDFLIASHKADGTRWIVSTSRRTDAAVGDKLAALAARDNSPIEEFIDFRRAGPGTLPGLFAKTQAILCTEDSSTMISEGVCARRPVVGVAPRHHSFKPDEREYRNFMTGNNWCRFMPLAQLTPGSFLTALGEVSSMRENHLDRLADILEQRLPQLF